MAGMMPQEPQQQPQDLGGLPIPEMRDAGRYSLPPAMEAQFQQWVRQLPWHQEFVSRYGEEPNLNDPNYDYRRAWMDRVPLTVNQHDQQYHWPSQTSQGVPLKSVHHPTAWMQHYMEATGGKDPEDPEDLQAQAFKEAWYRKYPPRY